MGRILVDSDRSALPSSTPAMLIARIQIISQDSEDGSLAMAPANADSLILLDNSGSMSGEKLEEAKEAALEFLKQLRPGDRLSIVTFSDTVRVRFQKVSKYEKEIEQAIKEINSEGGTNMYSALSESLKALEALGIDSNIQYSRQLLLLTDGQSTDGSEKEFIEIALQFQKKGIPIYFLGIGFDYNEDLLLKMYHANEIGFFKHINNASEISSLFNNISKQTVLYPSRNLQVKLAPGTNLVKIYKLEPQITPLTFERNDNNEYLVPIGNVGKEKQKILAKIELPERNATETKEFREAIFSVDMGVKVSTPLLIKRTNDLNVIKGSRNDAVRLEFDEAETSFLATIAMNKNDKESAKAIETIKRTIETIKSNPSMTEKFGKDKIKKLEGALDISTGTVKVSSKELKEEKDSFTRRASVKNEVKK
jgi:uncharacterized protein with von Willebrand factor type A (vWA) domain